MTGDLVHRRVRRAFRDLSQEWGTLEKIEDAFETEGFEPKGVSNVTGSCRYVFESYANAIDWKDRAQAQRALRVFQDVLSWGEGDKSESAIKAVGKLRRLLLEDGYVLDDEGRIREKPHYGNPELPLANLRDAESIREHLARLDPSDPPLAISSAKSLVEATCKCVLEELGEPYDEGVDIPSLVKSVQKALKLHPDTIAPTKKGRGTIVRVLSNLSQLVVGIAELRNEYGIDHGRTRPSGGLGTRHAQLAVGASRTYCEFLLETLDDRQRSRELSPATK